MSEEIKSQRNKESKHKTFPVSVYYSAEEIISTATNRNIKFSKEELIRHAFKFHSEGKILEAERLYKYFLDQGFSDQRVYSNYGVICQETDRKDQAIKLYKKSIKLFPNDSSSYSNLGTMLIDLGELKEAERLIRKAIELNPDFANAYSNLGKIMLDLRKSKEAEILTRKAIELDPKNIFAYYNLGLVLNDIGQLKEAELFTLKAIELKPDFADAYLNLGNILSKQGKFKEAIILLHRAIELKPNFVEANYNLANIHKDLGDLDEAIKLYQYCLHIKPNEIHRICDLIDTYNLICSWDEIEKKLFYLNKIGLEGKGVSPFSFLNLEDNPLNHLKRAIKFSNDNRKEELPNLNSYKKNKINIGYFSSDFKNHPISISLARVFELHNKSIFNIFAYSLGKIKDNYTKRIKDSVFSFKEVNDLSDFDIVKLVRDDKVDIAIDLNGYTKHNRISIFNYRVAPIQINYLGYPGTLGSKSFDYILADKVLIPEENNRFFTEKVLYLPDTSFPYDDTRKIVKNKFSRNELGLPLDGFVFTCFNRIEKITLREFKIWMSLLKRVDKSVLWLIKPNEFAIKNIYSEMDKHGIDLTRLIFAEKMNLDDHLSRHSCGDLFLDTFNFNAATTANIALSSGLPLITLLGNSYSARMAASILNACGLQELITHNESEYEELAYELSTNQDKLNGIREKIRINNNSSFFNSNKFTRDLELIYNNLMNFSQT